MTGVGDGGVDGLACDLSEEILKRFQNDAGETVVLMVSCVVE